MSPEDEKGGQGPEAPATRHRPPDDSPGLRRVEYALDPAAVQAFDHAAQHRAAAVRCIAAAVTSVATAAKIAGADHDDVVAAVTSLRRRLEHALAGAVAAELADGEWW